MEPSRIDQLKAEFGRLTLILITLLTLGSGWLNLYSVSHHNGVIRIELLRRIFPLELLRFSHFATLLLGMALVIAAVNIAKRKHRAWVWTIVLSGSSAVFQVLRARAYEEAAVSAVLFLALWLTRRNFSVRSRSLGWADSLVGLSVAIGALLFYGAAGFYYLDKTDFGVEFGLWDSMVQTIRLVTLTRDSALVPYTRHAAWFLDSISLLSAAAIAYSMYAIFRPVLYQLRTHPVEVEQARRIIADHGRSSLDFFKAWPEKSLFFSPTGSSFLAYRVGGGFAVVLGDPIGPSEELEQLVREFLALCHDNDWRVCFYQALPDALELYHRVGLHRLKIGDDAIVDLTQFALEGTASRAFRGKVRQLEKRGITTRIYEPPIPPDVLAAARSVSDEWLHIPGRREHGFSLGWFHESYVRNTPLFAVEDTGGMMLAFANIIPSGRKGEATVDMMRHRREAPNGIMDFLFVKLFLFNKELGFHRFTLGMAPMGGFRAGENAAPAERAVHSFVRHLNFLFSFQGLRAYKAKFASFWEPRYLFFQQPLDLPRIGLALRLVSGVRSERTFPSSKAAQMKSVLRLTWSWAVAAACLLWVFHDTELSKLAEHFRGIRWSWVLAAVACDIGSYCFEGIRWGRLLRPIGKLPFRRAVQAIYAGLFTNEVLPMRAGDMVQTYLGGRFIGCPFATVLPSIMVGALIDGLWVVFALGIVAEVIPLPSSVVSIARWFAIVLATMGGVLSVVIARRPRTRESRPLPSTVGWQGKVKLFLRQLVGGLEQMRPIPDLIPAFVYSAGIVVLQGLSFWLIMKAYGLNIAFFAGATVFLIVHISSAVPGAPSNIGSYQLVTVLGLQMFGIDKTQAAGFSMVVFVLLTLPFWIIGPIALARSGLKLNTIPQKLHQWAAS
ncbi:MAG TPA: flippase-like domain-containing protein [Bryobacteraceae bacterium]|nr:flippase-like domain-containing protein [Bryobacteraceae bacterium]